jgi:hypothetical protein
MAHARLSSPLAPWARDPQAPAAPRSKAATRSLAVVDALQLAAVATSLAFCMRALASRAPFEYGESDSATWAWMLRHGEPLYGPLAGLPMRFTHYPPLHLWLIARLATSDGAILPVARGLSLFGLALTALMARLCVARATGSARAGWSAALLLAGTCQLVYFGASGRGDLFGLGLGATAMTMLALRLPGWPLGSAVLFSLALLCKHNLVVLPVGALLWAAWRHPWQAVRLGLGMSVLVGAVVWRLELWTPLVSWTHTGWRFSSFAWLLFGDVLPIAAALAVVVQLLRGWRRIPAHAARVLEPWLVAAAVGCVWLLALGRVGSAANYLLEWLVAIAILSTAAAKLRIVPGWQRLHVVSTSAQTLATLLPLLLVAMPRVEAELSAARRALASSSGPVLAERTWLATATGHPPVVIPFFARQLAQRHLWSEAPLLALARRRQLTQVLLDFSLDDAAVARDRRDRFSPELIALLRRGYVLSERVGELRIYVPATTAAPVYE